MTRSLPYQTSVYFALLTLTLSLPACIEEAPPASSLPGEMGSSTTIDMSTTQLDMSTPSLDASTPIDMADPTTDMTKLPNFTIPDFDCTPQTDALLCEQAGAVCGEIKVIDHCGEFRQVDCAACTPGHYCDQEARQCTSCRDLDALCQEGTGRCGTLLPEQDARLTECGLPAIACGGCDGGQVCQFNRCTCPVEDDAILCAKADLQCGSHEVEDQCGQKKQVVCGECPGGLTCSPSGECTGGCKAQSDAQFCAKQESACGITKGKDNCGNTREVECGSCPGGAMCNGKNQCECPQKECTSECGFELDSCGNAVACAKDLRSCGGDKWCNQGQCACQAETEQQLCDKAAQCGAQMVEDRCGTMRAVRCGCEAPLLCVTGRCQGVVIENPSRARSGPRNRFGTSVALDRGRVLIGAPGDWNFDRSTIPKFDTNAWAYRINPETGELSAPADLRTLLTNENVVVDGEYFGGAVAISGEHAMVGAPLGDFFIREEGETIFGEAFFYRTTGKNNVWSFLDLPRRNFLLGSQGYSVDMMMLGERSEYGTALIGCPYSGLNDSNKNFKNVGTTQGFFFTESNASWNQKSGFLTTKQESSKRNSFIGAANAMQTHWAVVGRPGRNEVALYHREGFYDSWTQVHLFSQTSALMNFFYGSSVAISPNGRFIAIGRGVLKHQFDTPGAKFAHNVSLFENLAYNTTPAQSLTQDDFRLVAQFPGPQREDRFGSALAFGQDTLFIGAPGTDMNQGKVYRYTQNDEGVWALDDRPIQPQTDLAPGDAYGTSLDIDPNASLLLVGAPGTLQGYGRSYLLKY